jgi:hypothetical protein
MRQYNMICSAEDSQVAHSDALRRAAIASDAACKPAFEVMIRNGLRDIKGTGESNIRPRLGWWSRSEMRTLSACSATANVASKAISLNVHARPPGPRPAPVEHIMCQEEGTDGGKWILDVKDAETLP